MSIATEFKEFAMKGSVVDLAVGVVVGAAFGKIVSSFVADIITPPLGMLLSGQRFDSLAVTLGTGPEGEDIVLRYGAFLQTVFDFAIIAFVLFLVIRGINKLKRPAPEAAPAAPPRDEVLLEEIRDLLKQRQ